MIDKIGRSVTAVLLLAIGGGYAPSVFAQDEPSLPHVAHTVAGGDGLALAVQEWGDKTGPDILFIHGFSQNHMSWVNQLESGLADRFHMVSFDIRGHGNSAKPLAPEHYGDSRLWADDVNAVITTLALKKPVLVVWSYGGFIVSDYLRFYSDDDIGGVVMVAAATKIGTDDAPRFLGDGVLEILPGMLSPDYRTQFNATVGFVQVLTAEPLPHDRFLEAIGINMMTPPAVRLGLVLREVDNDDVLAQITVPVLVSHGTADRIVLQAAGQHTAKLVPHATESYYEGIGHAPFIEATSRFNNELVEFVTSVQP